MWRFSILAPVLALLAFGGLVMACLLPQVELSAEEKRCCEEMAGECQPTGSGMLASHSCCTIVVRSHKEFLPSASVPFFAPLSECAALIALPVVPEIESLSRNDFWSKTTHGPPDQALDASAPLRI